MPGLCVSRTSRLAISIVLIVLGVTQPSWVEVVNADGEGWYSSWQLRKAITIDATKVSSGPHTNFPVLINLSSDASLAARAQSYGDDILFTSSDGATKLSHEIEKYGSSTGELVAWVKVPSLPSTSNTVLYMYYGNDAAASQQNATAVWDANYKGVWHLKESGDHIGNDYLDSTSNAKHGQGGGGSATRVPLAATGKIGVSLDFNGTGDGVGSYVSIPSTFDIASLPFTIEAWVNPDDFGDYGAIFGKRDSAANADMRVDLGLNQTTGAVYTYDGGQQISTFSPTVGTWTHLVFVARSAAVSVVYGNGAVKSTFTGVTLGQDATAAVSIGITQNGGDDSYDGRIDELRISNVERAAGWILTEFNNQGTPTTFYAVGSATSPTANFFQLFE